MAADVAALRDKIQRILTENLGSVEIDKEGDWSVRHGSARVFIRLRDWGDDQTVVDVWAETNGDVPSSPELYKYVAQTSHVFGSLSAYEEDGKASVIFRCTLLGDFLDPDELMNAIYCVASSGDNIDDEIQARFGGRRFHED